METDRLSVSYKGKHSYDIIYRDDFSDLPDELSSLGCHSRKICIVTDSNVGSLYVTPLQEAFSTLSSQTVVFTFPAGEHSKNLSTVQDLYTFLITHHFDRNDVLVALGGGVVGDLTGFAAATYLRGIRFVQIPTSLLAMSDSSIGGKTGVDFESYKNMVGAFYMPILVYMNINTLHTLPDKEYYSGFAEIIKHGYIKDYDFILWLKKHKEDIILKDIVLLKEMAYKNNRIKKTVVENDPKEKGERALLNFGHTIGHAVEKSMNFSMLHGECVAVGMIAATYIAYKRTMITEECLMDMIQTLDEFHLPVSITSITADEIVYTAGFDKKKDGDTIKFILLSEPGNAVINSSITTDEMKEAADYILSL